MAVCAQASPLGGFGIFATKDFLPGDEVFAEEHLARLDTVSALDQRDELSLKEKFDQLALASGGQTLAALRDHSFFRGPQDALGEERRGAFDRWAIETWPEDVEYQVAMAEAMTIMSYNSYSCPGNEGQLLYPTISKVNHSCAANATTIAAQDCGQLMCVLPITAGEEIFSSYLSDVDLIRPIQQRRQILSKGWDFQCCCPRCKAFKDDTRRFSCHGLRSPPRDPREPGNGAMEMEEQKGECPGACLTADGVFLPCDYCGFCPSESSWLQREEEGEELLEALPEGMYTAWAKMEEFATAHPLHGLSGRWKKHLAYHTEKELRDAEAEEVSELSEDLSKYWSQHWRCLAALLPQRHEGAGRFDSKS